MRRVLPSWASLVAVLLLLQWSGAAAPCLTQPDVPAMVLCHVSSDGGPLQPSDAGDHVDVGCPLCAPLPPLILTSPPPLPPAPSLVPTDLVSELPGRPASVPPLLTPQQPRAPPTPS